MEFVQNNLWLILIAALSGGMLIWPTLAKLVSGALEISVQQMVQLINRNEAVVLDVREPAEFSAGHIARARSVPLGKLAERIGELEKFKNRTLVVCCASGHRSSAACALLKKSGFTQVAQLKGGFAAWQQAGMPVDK